MMHILLLDSLEVSIYNNYKYYISVLVEVEMK